MGNLEFRFSRDKSGVADGDAGNVGDAVQRAGRAVKRDTEIAAAWLGRRLALTGSEPHRNQKTREDCESAKKSKTDHLLFFSQEDCADRINLVFFSTAFSSNAACCPANFQSLFSTASVKPGNSRCA